MQTDTNKALIKRFYEDFYNRGRLASADEMHAPQYVYHDLAQPEQPIDHEGYKRRKAIIQEAFPDQVVHIEDVIAEGDKVVVRATMYAIQSGPLPGIPTTGKEVRIASTSIYRFSENKIVEEWELWDALGLYQQLGVDPFKHASV